MPSHTLRGFVLALLLGNAMPAGAEQGCAYIQDLQDSLVAYTATDFAAHGPRPDGFRNVDLRYRENDHGARSYMLCGQFRVGSGPDADWVDFATIKTTPYEQWIGGSAADMCAHAVAVSPGGQDLSSELKSALVASGAMAQAPPADAAAGARSTPVGQQADHADFLAFLDRLDAVLQRFANGDADAFKDVWDHTDDITVAGGFGGAIVQGWNVLGLRLSGVADTYSNTVFDARRIAAGATGDFGYVIQHEYFRREEASEPYRQYRVTMLFRRAAGEWKLFHRHADGQMDFRVPD